MLFTLKEVFEHYGFMDSDFDFAPDADQGPNAESSTTHLKDEVRRQERAKATIGFDEYASEELGIHTIWNREIKRREREAPFRTTELY